MPGLEDLTGKNFGMLAVVSRGDNDASGHSRWWCVCDCGRKILRHSRTLKNLGAESCGCLRRDDALMHLQDDLTGRKFGKLTVLYKIDKKDKRHPAWMCQCDCGNKTRRRAIVLLRGESVQCNGCSSIGNKHGKTHGGSKHPLYAVWKAMRQRCCDSWHPCYPDYGGRGIMVCDEWNDDFKEFYNWSMQNGYKKGLMIERIDNDKGYWPENCKWATPLEQAHNRRSNHIITINGCSKPYSAWASEYGIKQTTFYGRISRGWSGEKLLSPAKEQVGGRK